MPHAAMEVEVSLLLLSVGDASPAPLDVEALLVLQYEEVQRICTQREGSIQWSCSIQVASRQHPVSIHSASSQHPVSIQHPGSISDIPHHTHPAQSELCYAFAPSAAAALSRSPGRKSVTCSIGSRNSSYSLRDTPACLQYSMKDTGEASEGAGRWGGR